MWFHPRWWTGPEQSLDYVVTDLVVPLSDKTKATDRSARWSSRVISHRRRIVAGLVKCLHRILYVCVYVCVDKYIEARACMGSSIQVLVFEFQISWIFAALNKVDLVERKINGLLPSNSIEFLEKRICPFRIWRVWYIFFSTFFAFARIIDFYMIILELLANSKRGQIRSFPFPLQFFNSTSIILIAFSISIIFFPAGQKYSSIFISPRFLVSSPLHRDYYFINLKLLRWSKFNIE